MTAWPSPGPCAEALHDRNRARTLFATHYHELAGLETRLAHVCNLSMKAREWNGELVFLHEAAPGAADRSYGVQVAKLAGRARRRGQPRPRGAGPAGGRKGGRRQSGRPAPVRRRRAARPAAVRPSSRTRWRRIEPDELSPREALEALYRLKGLAGR